MCTSFACYNKTPIYGMNFDYNDVKLKFDIVNENSINIFQLMFQIDGEYVPTAGFNSNGVFGAAQVMVSDIKIFSNNSDNFIEPFDVYKKAMEKASKIEYIIEDVIGQKKLNYCGQLKGHQLYADKYGHAVIIEPSLDGNSFLISDEKDVVMTNFSNSELLNRDINSINGFGIDRYITATNIINSVEEEFDYNLAFEVLKKTQLSKGQFTTQCSMVINQESMDIFICIRRDFNKIWRLSLMDKTIETYRGFKRYKKVLIDQNGVTEIDLV
ncbi:hypothetical protein [Vallitalea guaymasensis]|uniref:Linear amide C-N hydrolase n=1 Tax=Vallitalea guaymasensis TaxID=1185412 RepID=A0A8J8M836_9FIRM|nr:hypothetical protein [Vallitalea guaymasensis]QUH28101.1 hypothetical protein HYG85_03890 [Vallitalea guaymasensis]